MALRARCVLGFFAATVILAAFGCSGSTKPNDGDPPGTTPDNGETPGGTTGGTSSGTSAGATGGSTFGGTTSGSTSGSTGGATTAGTGGATTGSSTGAPTAAGCDGANLLARPDDLGAKGPWPVGAKTMTVAGLKTEVWYPATLGSDSGKAKRFYDIREHLPAADQTKIPDSQNPLQPCDCFADLPFDTSHGPYPVVVFVHGTAAFRTQTLTQTVHWASRGFVVVAADHPGLHLPDILGSALPTNRGDQVGDAGKILDALAATEGDLAFLAGHIDMGHVGMAGHSAGGGAIAGFGSRAGVKVLIPMAAGGSNAGTALESTLIMGGQDDKIAQYSRVSGSFAATPTKKRLVGLAKAGHLAFSDLCYIGRDRGGILKIAQDNGVKVNFLVALLARDGCNAGQLSAEDGWAIVNYATSGVLEESLMCATDAAAKVAKLPTLFPAVAEYKEEL